MTRRLYKIVSALADAEAGKEGSQKEKGAAEDEMVR